jgi:hypothetical protein
MTFTIERPFHSQRHEHGRKAMQTGSPSPVLAPGRVPRISRLMALAIRFEEQVRTGVLGSYVELATLGHVTRARISQIMNLVNLAPDLQEVLLFLPKTEQGRDPIHLRQLQPIASIIDWRMQRRLWQALLSVPCA